MIQNQDTEISAETAAPATPPTRSSDLAARPSDLVPGQQLSTLNPKLSTVSTSAQILEIMTDVGTDVLRDAVLANPLNYFRMLSAFTGISNSGLRCERHLADQSERQAKLSATAPSALSGAEKKKGLSPATFQTLNHDLNLM